MSKKQGLYGFCVIPIGHPCCFGKVRLEEEDREVFTVSFQDMAMVVAKVPIKIYLPRRENLKAHQDVISQVMNSFSVIPMSFGNIFKTQEDIRVLLKKLYLKLKEIFTEIHGKIEVGLKIFGKTEWLTKESERIPEIKKAKLNQRLTATSYYEKIAMGELARDFLLQIKMQIEDEIFRPLTGLAVAAKANDTVSETMLLNGAFLIEKAKETLFDEEVNRLYQKWHERVDFSYTGPWPAYNFINIKIKVLRD